MAPCLFCTVRPSPEAELEHEVRAFLDRHGGDAIADGVCRRHRAEVREIILAERSERRRAS